MTESERIDPADLRTALGTCMRDKELQRLFKCAPEGAKKVLKLSFYATVFPEKIDGHKFRVNLRAIEPELSSEDLEYLIRFEPDAQLKVHFKELLASRTSGTPAASAEPFGRPESKVRLIRSTDGLSVDLNAEAMKRRLAEDEVERATECARATQSRRKTNRDRLLKALVTMLVALVVFGGGLVWFLRWDAEQKEQAQHAKLLAEEARLKFERQKAEAEKVRQERDAQAKKMRAERDAQAKKASAERETKRRQRQVELELQRKEESAAIAHSAAVRDEFDRVEALFRGAKPVAWNTLPKEKRPGAVDGTFFCAISPARGVFEFFKVESQAGDAIKVVGLSRTEDPKEIDFQEWNEKLNAAGGIVYDGIGAYLFAPKAKPEGFTLPSGDFRPAQLRLGELASMMRSFGMETESLATEVLVSANGIKGATAKFTVGFSDYLDWRTVREGLRKGIEAVTPRASVKQKRRTAMLYDGNILKKQMNGVVLVPRNPLRVDTNYINYRDEAERQEREAEQSVADAEAKRQAEVNRRLERALESAKMSISVKF